jgi:hypothetical protein
MTPYASSRCRQDMAQCHRQPETWCETFGETITGGVVVSF